MGIEVAVDTLKTLWQMFDRGDPLTDDDLETLRVNAVEGLRYLQARGDNLTSFKTISDLEKIRSFQWERQNFP